MRPPVPFKWKGNHHAYHGIWIMAFSIFNLYMAHDNIPELNPFFIILYFIGGFLFMDDFLEHTWSADTPLRILWEKIYKVIKK